MGNIKSHESYDYPPSTTTPYNDERPPLGYPTPYHQAGGEDPFLSLLEGFSHVYLQGKDVIERLFPGACDELLDFLNKIAIRELVPKMENRSCSNTMKRSLSMDSVFDNERFKVRELDVGGDAELFYQMEIRSQCKVTMAIPNKVSKSW